MPLYEYECESCGALFELIRKFSDPPLDKCPTCGAGPVRKLISSPAIQFKGSGFYINDYARKSGGTDSGSREGKETKDTGSPASESASKDSGKDAGKDTPKDSAKEPAKTSTDKTAAPVKAESKS